MVNAMEVARTGRGPEAHRTCIERTDGRWNRRVGREEPIEDRRSRLVFGRERPPRPVPRMIPTSGVADVSARTT